MLDQQYIDEFLQREDINFRLNASEYLFEKPQTLLKEWLKLELEQSVATRLLELKKDYQKLLKLIERDADLGKVVDLLFDITAYCDFNAKEKNERNEYPDKRVVADASVRMKDWVHHLILFKFDPENLPEGSASNAFNYLLNPQENSSVLSRNHRRLICQTIFKKDCQNDSFAKHLVEYFKQFKIPVVNESNRTLILGHLLYSMADDWKDEVIGLMASDRTGWQEDHIQKSKGHTRSIIWNSKKPTKGQRTLQPLREILDEQGAFYLYYCFDGKVRYRASIVDFVISQEEQDQKNWKEHYVSLFGFCDKFSDYNDGKKYAYIVFLSEYMERVEPVDVSLFTFFDGTQRPRQDNISPVRTAPEITSILANLTKHSMKKGTAFHNIQLNQILFGPPGTGKTYQTRELAVRICDPDFKDFGDREMLKARYEELEKLDQIGFVTFHQSFTYEDFVEGIKPRIPAEEELEGDTLEYSDNLGYSIEKGVFLEMCKRASNTPVSNDFEELWTGFARQILDRTDPVIFQSTESKMRLEPEKSSVESFKLRFLQSWDPDEEEGTRIFPVGKSLIQKVFAEKVNVSPEAPNKWLNVADIVGRGRATLALAVYKSFWQYCEEKGVFDEEPDPSSHVLIIDEINRGNVSQIFGELITLIEPDKRIGGDEELMVTLPYSKAPFGVPSNLHIIGTMNTADRSVEALDTALRRRFAFKEIKPSPDLLSSASLVWHLWWKYKESEFWDEENYLKAESALYGLIGKSEQLEKDKFDLWAKWEELGRIQKGQVKELAQYDFNGVEFDSLLQTVNNRLALLLDKDHMIGHSYFFSLIGAENGESELLSIFYDKIIPLLEEYFYGDFGKIGLVLGKAFVTSPKDQADNGTEVFADFELEDKDVFAQKKIYQIIDYRNPEGKEEGRHADFLEAVKSIYSEKQMPSEEGSSTEAEG